jgi:pseudouridine-5'-phosphate glycosidase
VLQRVDDLAALASIINTKYELGLKGGVVVANPIPVEDEIPAAAIDRTIEEALSDAHKQGISGKAVTPFLLKNIVERTQGKSLQSNIALVKNNARVGARLAVSLASCNAR